MKTCPNCGSQQPENVKFCTNCGFAFPAEPGKTPVQEPTKAQSEQEPTKFQQQYAQPQETKNPNENVEQAKSFAKDYWFYFLNAVKHPTILENGHKYFGFATIILFALFNDLFVKLLMNSVARSVTSAVDSTKSFLSAFGESTTTGSSSDAVSAGQATLESGLYAKLFFLTLIVFAIYVLIGFFVRNVVLGDKTDTLMSFTNRFTHYLMVNLGLSVVSMVLMLSGMKGAAVFIYFLMALIMSVAFILAIVIDTNPVKIDRLYGVVIGQLLLAFVVFIIMTVFAVSLASNLTSIMHAAGL
ncbi:zinc ribbon domain-containing protein [Dellaglioa algida]|uniref:Zinc ribbon domain-containing protein n=1 Tax=Dellaglioa algida TaxID=105612 RepID=A0A2C8ESP7_9LACO|nr:zinc ribbon domain-containing protein [Dellaglioa algida]MDK1716206.1 zinc ribbon domain-containing protein [Dellaglioa algida]MDK1717894.1 zinc ribbon domain-containing protein [Dellaglioa algida]MDK1719487.1 zinc ribbon domain-containing protein [Dellaglioa algida]MDK1721011.1 zinc ribbon domain-containing protein [Dellaglioa algida]MDK1722830.1 zinc ribbon domain-containing protein [Dellaglioa algida]